LLASDTQVSSSGSIIARGGNGGAASGSLCAGGGGGGGGFVHLIAPAVSVSLAPLLSPGIGGVASASTRAPVASSGGSGGACAGSGGSGGFINSIAPTLGAGSDGIAGVTVTQFSRPGAVL
jgi:hypothetical protein